MTVDQHPLLNPLILHFVLSNLPKLEILLAQRVCRTWHNTIQNSTRLQRTLFLLHDPTQDEQDDIIMNDVLATHFPDFFHPRSGQDWCLGPFKTTRWFAAATSNPPDLRVADAYSRPDASWRRMYPSQPAPRQLNLLTVNDGRGPSSGRFRKFSVLTRDGSCSLPAIPFGPIYDIVQAGEFPSHTRRIGRSTRVQLAGQWIERRDDDVYGALELGLARFDPRLGPGQLPDDPEVRRTYRSLTYRWDRDIGRFRTALPEGNFASLESVTVEFTHTKQCKRGGVEGRKFSAEFLRSGGSVIVMGKEVQNEKYEWPGIDWDINVPFQI